MTPSPTIEDQKTNLFLSVAKIMLSFADRFGVEAIDWIGYALGLNIDNKPVSEQTMSEMLTKIRELSEKVSDPRYMKYLKAYIERLSIELEPIIREKMTILAKLIIDILNEHVEDIPNIIANAVKAVPGLGSIVAIGSVINNITELASGVTGLGAEILDNVKDSYEKTNDIIKRNRFDPPNRRY